MSFQSLTIIRILLALTGMGLAFGYYLYRQRDGGRATPGRIYTAALVCCAGLGLYTYLGLGPQFRNTTAVNVMNPHDFFHYYVGAKYHRELGYFDLYECSLIADHETTKSIDPTWRIRDLRTYGYRTAAQVTAHPQHCRSLFSNARWAEFKDDVRFISRLMAPSRWNEVLRDKGYNATPIWTRFIATLTDWAPLTSAVGLWGLLGLDYFYTAIAFVVVGLTFGWRNGLLVILFWGVNYMTSTDFVKGSVSRVDWVLCMLLALCLLQRGRHAWAGLAAGLATALRIFPVLFFVGLACKALHTVLRTRRLPREYLRFLAGFVASLGLLAGLTSLTGHDRERWRDFSVKIASHDQQIAGFRVGLKYALIEPGPGAGSARKQLESKQHIWWIAQTLMLAAVFLASRRLADHETLGVSFLCVFFLTAPTFYYYQMLVIPFMLFLPDLRRRAHAVGLAAFFGWCVLGYVLRLNWQLGLTLSHWLSWSLLGLCAVIVLVVLAAQHEGQPDAPRPLALPQ